MDLTVGQYNLVYNAFSFTIAAMGAATIFFFINRDRVAPAYRATVTITGLVTLVACYHYFRIFNSWQAAYSVSGDVVSATGVRFNDAYRYIDWLLTVPLLLIELILVMRLPREETIRKSVKLSVLAALMIILGYPGEISSDAGTRWLWWTLGMIPFVVIVYDLFVGLHKSISEQPANVRGMVSAARWLTVIAWCFYPVVFVFPMIGLTGGIATAAVQVGYSVADVVAKALFGLLIFLIAVRKSELELEKAYA